MTSAALETEAPPKRSRGTSNSNDRGSAEDRRKRKEFLLDTYRANVDVAFFLSGEPFSDRPALTGADRRGVFLITAEGTWADVPLGSGRKACRCYRCGTLLWFEVLTVDRIVPGCKGGTYRRTNIRPACSGCNTETGAPMANGKDHKAAKQRAAKRRAAAKAGGKTDGG